VGVLGFIVLENKSPLESLWLTVITLTTVGYGDVYAKSEAGQVFTILLLVFGIGAFAFAAQAAIGYFASPNMRDLRQKRRVQATIKKLQNHYIICGSGEMVDKTIRYLKWSAEVRRTRIEEEIYRPVDDVLDSLFGDDALGHHTTIRGIMRDIFLLFVRLLHRGPTILDVVVVITQDGEFAEHVRRSGLLVIEGDPTDASILQQGGAMKALAMMVMLDSDTETLLTVLTAHTLNPTLRITAATLEVDLTQKMLRVGANAVLTPLDVAAQFLNGATLRPAVNEYFGGILFDHKTNVQLVQLYLLDDSPWIGKRLSDLQLRERFKAGVIGLQLDDGHFLYAPDEDYLLEENEILLVVAPGRNIRPLEHACREGTSTEPRLNIWQRLPIPTPPPTSVHIYERDEAEQAVREMSKHFVICGSGRVARNTINKLNPERPFVIISEDKAHADELLQRGFRVIYGNSAQESILRKAGAERAQAVMVAVEDKADSVLTVLTCRSLSKNVLITATAGSDDVIPKLERAGADKVVSTFHIAAQFIILTTTRPAISDFMQYVIFNYRVGIETTELYMQHDSPWIDQTIDALHLKDRYNAGVIGVRLANGRFIYAPPGNHQIGMHEVLIIVTPMEHSDELRITAQPRRPDTLRQLHKLQTDSWNRAIVTEPVSGHLGS
jgi:voltage-gated potassium channel